ncbi:MAG TPA: hypothetical protein VMF33_04060 [Acidimicrobiales bacterium]|nr:hypothetical protein [Acidimicrobiales bacterium]
MSLTGYSYPWDYLGDEAAFDRVAFLELDVVALAASYHATRLATPLHPTRRITAIESSAAYIPLREEIWASRRLRPPQPPEWIGPRAFIDAATRLNESGTAVDGWIVLTHVDDAGDDHDFAVRNAFGEVYAYALCPSQDAVRDYCRTLVTETLRSAPLRGVVLEACGPMGLEHSGTHEKLDMARWRPAEYQLLSMCFCRACETGMRKVGLEPDDLAQRIRGALTREITTIDDALGDMSSAAEAFRLSLSATLQREVVDAVRQEAGDATITLHASADPWSVGSFAPSNSEVLAQVNCAVANCWDESRAELELASLAPITGTLGAYVRLDHEWPRPQETLTGYAQAGVRELHLYHLGLLSAASLVAARRLASAWGPRRGVGLEQIEESLSDG